MVANVQINRICGRDALALQLNSRIVLNSNGAYCFTYFARFWSKNVIDPPAVRWRNSLFHVDLRLFNLAAWPDTRFAFNNGVRTHSLIFLVGDMIEFHMFFVRPVYFQISVEALLPLLSSSC